MLFNIASAVLALQLGMPGHAQSDGQAVAQEIQYRVPVRPLRPRLGRQRA
jgi:hypothetical protein